MLRLMVPIVVVSVVPERDHIRSIDKRRIRRAFGRVTSAELSNIDQGLDLFLGLAPEEQHSRME